MSTLTTPLPGTSTSASSVAASTPSGLGSGPVSRSSATEGRTRITARALNRLIAAVAADALGVSARSVSIDLTDTSGHLAVTVRSPLRVVSLTRVHQDSGIVARTGGTLLERAAAAQKEIRVRAAALSGSSISSVTVRLTGIDVQPERRVL